LTAKIAGSLSAALCHGLADVVLADVVLAVVEFAVVALAVAELAEKSARTAEEAALSTVGHSKGHSVAAIGIAEPAVERFDETAEAVRMAAHFAALGIALEHARPIATADVHETDTGDCIALVLGSLSLGRDLTEA
jgi:hypothetical protein